MAVVDNPTDQASLVTWLWNLVTVEGIDPQLLRVDLRVEPDGSAPDECDEATRDAWQRWQWWHVRCRATVAFAFVEDPPERWLVLGSAEVGRVVEGQQPGRPFINVWEDYVPGWENLTEAAVADAARTLSALQGVKVEWTNTTVDQPVSGSLPGC